MKSGTQTSLTAILTTIFLGLLALQASAQLFPDSLKVPVTFYDYHADFSNPEFEPKDYITDTVKTYRAPIGLMTKMVKPDLDADRKPIPGDSIFWSASIDKWFRPWQPDRNRPVYDRLGRYLRTDVVSYDTSFKNIMINDTLVFRHVGGGVYEYDNLNFFPLDGKGFKNDHTISTKYNHNYSFTMEIHREFTYTPGLKFAFRGDDDVWVFINGKLAMDIGGIHDSIARTVDLSNLGLEAGKTYPFDFFYCERHVVGSKIKITSNVIAAEPNQLHIQVQPDDTITAGDTARAFAVVLDQKGDTLRNLDGTMSWKLLDDYNSPATFDTISPTSVQFVPTKAYTTARIIGRYVDGPININDTATIYVQPAAPHHVVIEASAQRPALSDAALRNDNPRTEVIINSNQTTDTLSYAILRDRYGNWCAQNGSLSSAPQWGSLNTTRVSITVGPHPLLGQATLTRVGAGSTTAWVQTTQGFRDSVPVTVRSYTITDLRFAVQSGAVLLPITSLSLSVDSHQVLLAEGRNSAYPDQWEPVSVGWSVSGVSVNGTPPANANNWDVKPLAADTGTITIRSGSLSAALPVFFTSGAPRSLVLYPQSGTPNVTPNSALSAAPIAVTAGQGVRLYAKMFDQVAQWLSIYENTVDSAKLISWTVVDETNASYTAYVDKVIGNTVLFTPLRAHHTYRLVATFRNLYADTVLFAVGPAAAARLSIEASPERSSSPNLPQPIDTVRLSNIDELKTVYAILRDSYGNFVRPSDSTSWSSVDTAIVRARVGSVSSSGEGAIVRSGVQGVTTVRAQSLRAGAFQTSVAVVLEPYTYTQLRLGVRPATDFIDINTLLMRTDEDTMLLALGKRSDNNQWEAAKVAWLVNGLTVASAPASSSSWEFAPRVVGSGTIYITNGSVSDSLAVTVVPGLPMRLDVYARRGNPQLLGLAPYRTPPQSDTVNAGQKVGLVAKLFDSNIPPAWLGQYESNAQLRSRISWRLEQSGTGSFDTTRGDSVCFTPTRAYTTLRIIATYTDGATQLSDVVQLTVRPGGAAALFIEASPNPLVSPNAPAPLSRITLSSRDTTRNAFAVVRDQYGNFVRSANDPRWSSTDTTVARVLQGFAINGEGVVRRTLRAGTTTVSAVDRISALQASVTVDVAPYTIDKLQIVVQPGRLADTLNTLTMRTDEQKTLLVLGRRSDNGVWEPVSVDWSALGTPLNSTPLNGVQFITFSPQRAGSGSIVVTKGAVTDTVRAAYLTGLPALVDIYDALGNPQTLRPYPQQTIEVTAGDTLDLVAKIFDNATPPAWLRSYEDNPALASRISWMVDDNSVGLFDRTQGAGVHFVPTRAHSSVLLRATYSNGADTTLSRTISIHVNPAAPAALTLEGSPNLSHSPYSPLPLESVTLTSRDTVSSAYAVLRDRFGNFVGASNPTRWSVDDTTVVKARTGFAISGEGVIRRNGVAGSAVVSARDSLSGLVDEVRVTLMAYTIDSLRMVVLRGFVFSDITQLTMRTDADTTLFALGLRSDNGAWIPQAVNWHWTGPSLAPPALGSVNSWSFSPVDTGRGTIRIENGLHSDSLTTRFVPGLPASLVIYPSSGSPATQLPFGTSAVEAIAGDSIALFAKLFDNAQPPLWLKNFEDSAALNRRISWTMSDSGAGVFVPTVGSATRFVPTKAYTTLTLTATYRSGDTLISGSMRMAINAGAPAQLSIEASPQQSYSPNSTRPLSSLTLNNTDTTRTAFAVLRDSYGNYVRPSNPTQWSSANTAVVSVRRGFVINGEGVVRRSATSGSTVVGARDSVSGLLDSVAVVVEPYTIDSLRIVIVGSDSLIAIDELTIRTDQDTTLRVIGRRSDTGEWISVSADWSSTIAVDNVPPTNSSIWTLSTSRPGKGIIVVSTTGARDTIVLNSNPGLPHSLSLYRSAGEPKILDQYPSSRLEVRAGDTVAVFAKIFDRFEVWLQSYQDTPASRDSISWSVEEALDASGATGTLSASKGAGVNYVPTVAFRSVVLIARLSIDGGRRLLSDTLALQVVPAVAHHVVIEGTVNARTVSPNADNPLDTLRITARDTVGSAYLILRDKFGNFVSNSVNSRWEALDTAVVHALAGASAIGEGRVLRVDGGITRVQGGDLVEAGLSVRLDSVPVKVVDYYYEELRIVYKDTTVLSSLTITTNDDTTLLVIGRKSNGSGWEPVDASWEISEGLRVDPMPSVGSRWSFSPVAPGAGSIRVYLNNQITKPDTIAVTFAPGAPVKLTMAILTPADSIIAGSPVALEVRLYNEDGLVPGPLCYANSAKALYWDNLGDGGRPLPTIDLGSGVDTLNVAAGATHRYAQCFAGGLDTVRVRLYYAPSAADSLHQIGASIGGIEGATPLFRLLPEALVRLELETGNRVVLADTSVIRLFHPDGAVSLYAVGYDRYGNRRGYEKVDWSHSGTLHAIEDWRATFRIYYDARRVRDAEQGFISARFSASIVDSVEVRVFGPLIALTNALTQDKNGNGLLDRIEVRFDKPFAWPSSGSGAGGEPLTISYEGYTFEVDSVVGVDSTWDSAFVIYLKEDAKLPQTSWTPKIELQGIDGVQPYTPATPYVSTDGAGPVVWKVVKTVSQSDSRQYDKITVTFSEPVQAQNGRISPATSPHDIFQVYYLNPISGKYELDTLIFKGIDGLTAPPLGDTALVFYMTNGKDISDRHQLRIDSSSGLVFDIAGATPPRQENVRRKVIIIGNPPSTAVPGPSPARPDFRHVPAGELRAAHDPIARPYIARGGKGTIINLKISLPQLTPTGAMSERIALYLKVYDVAGNLVNQAFEKDVVGQMLSAGDDGMLRQTVADVDLYWNGSNQSGMAVSPGVYRAIIVLDYQKSNELDARVSATIGITP